MNDPMNIAESRRRVAAARLLRREYQKFRVARAKWRFAREDAAENLGDGDMLALLRGWTRKEDLNTGREHLHRPHVFEVITGGGEKAEE